MLKVRLQRVGRRNDPSFRIVVTEKSRGPKSSKYMEMLGSYNPRQKLVSVKGDRIKYWISQGAQVSDTVHNILVGQEILEGKKINVLPKKQPIVKKEETEKKVEDGKQEATKSDTENVSSAEDSKPSDAAAAETEKEDKEKSESSNESQAKSQSEETKVDEKTAPSDQSAEQADLKGEKE